KFLVLFMRGVWGMVSGDAIHSAISQACQQRFAVFTRTQRRVHFVVGVVLAYIFVQQREMVRRDLAGPAQVVALGFADGTERSGGRQMRNVVAAFGFGREA